jgi:hypothetical protein
MFESEEQPRPAEPELEEERKEAPVKTKRTVLLEMFTDEFVVRKTFENRRRRFAFEIATEFDEEEPMRNNSETSVPVV